MNGTRKRETQRPTQRQRPAEYTPSLPDNLDSEEYHAKLCHLYVEGGLFALRHTFSQIHPAETLTERLAHPDLSKPLRRLRSRGVLTQQQWEVLYPLNKRHATCHFYDGTLLGILLRNACRLSAPYPHGWEKLPTDGDYSMAADIVRLQLYRKALVVMGEEQEPMSTEQFQVYWKQLTDLIIRLAGEKGRNAVTQIEGDKLNTLAQKNWVRNLRIWHETSLEASNRDRSGSGTADDDVSKLTKTNFKSDRAADYPAKDKRKENGENGEEYEESEEGEDDEDEVEAKSKSKYSRQAQLAKELEEETIYAVERSLEKDILEKYCDELTQQVKSEEVLPKLVARGVISHEEKNKISLMMRNSDRMKLVIELLCKKSGKSFDLFCDIIKFKHKGLYNKLLETKKAPVLVGQQDAGSQLVEALRNKYKAVYSKCVPIPWRDTVYAPIHDFFVHPYITDLRGRDVKDGQLFDAYATNENPRRILIEGASGIGKTTFCRHLAYEWARGNVTWDDKFKIVIHIDVRMIHKKGKEIEDVILDQCLPFSYKTSREEVTNVLQANQNQILFIFDGIESQRQTQALSVLYTDRYPGAGVIATINKSFVSNVLLQNFDTRLILVGQHHEDQPQIVRNYSRLVQRSLDIFQPLLRRIVDPLELEEEMKSHASSRKSSTQNDETETEQNGDVWKHEEEDDTFVLSLNPMACLCMCLVCEYITEDLPFFGTMSNVMEAFVTALHKLYCNRFNLFFQSGNLPQQVNEGFPILEVIAFNAAFGYVDIMSTESLYKKYKNKDFIKFGLLQVFLAGQRSCPIESCYFACTLLQDYLAARHMETMELEDFREYVEQLVTDPNLHNVAVFFTGIQHQYATSQTLDELFKRLAAKNLSADRGLSTLQDERPETRGAKPQSAKTNTTSATIASQSTLCSTSQTDAGRISDLHLCLECLHECAGQEDAVRVIVDTLPSKLYSRKKAIPSYSTIGGLSEVLKCNSSAITELDLHLDHLTHYNHHASTQLAQVLEKSKLIQTLRLRWTSVDMLALFLAQIFRKNTTIHTLKIYDEMLSHEDGITANVWSSFQSASKGMSRLRTFAFTYCKNPQMIMGLLRNIPDTIQELDFNHCRLDEICANQLAKKIETSSRLKALCLRSVEIDKTAFFHISLGFRHSRTLVELNLSHTGLNQYYIRFLTEALGFNKGIRRLDLSRNPMDGASSNMLAETLAANRTLQEVNVRDCGLNEEDKDLLRAKKRANITVLGVNARRPTSSFYTGS